MAGTDDFTAQTKPDSSAGGPESTAGGTASPSELAKFAAMAESWWDPDGKFKPLHKFNPIRLAYIRDHLASHFARPVARPEPFSGLTLLDIGCGGGLLTEPMTRLGFTTTGVDALERNVQVARLHAARSGLTINYRCAMPEALLSQGLRYDVVLAMEVVEHVSDVDLFLSTASELVAPGGILLAATLNRTIKSFVLGKVGAEYILRWLPRGTHDWRKFVQPSELSSGLRGAGMTVKEIKGMSYNPFADLWSITNDLEVNYVVVAVKPG
ncbi:MAG: bifunctional 2-polyprenyl-6-hydroxyphenol methylase/3-demethylubiquinol 3-O-methyltransferase UbiG [Alphaproteobacteria bacterium]|nr:bifunctional 2-polyprenyl-6-hydroxyphenol methylase/3-demethylubiquinol 3-O-methyltransferase UbiG [Alphaproteobacteria bacterium]